MKIVVLDGYTLNPGDLSWQALQSVGDCDIYDRTPAEQVISRSAEADIILVNKTIIDEAIINALPKLKYIGVLATGYNVVDLEAARVRGIPVTNVPEYGTFSVAQMVFAHILNYANHVYQHHNSVMDGQWTKAEDFSYWNQPLIELQEQTLGIIGLGKIGRAVADIGLAFGMKVIAHSRSTPDNLATGIKLVEQDEVFWQSDFLSLHCPLTQETDRLVNKQTLNLMKSTAVLINTSRGQLVDETSLADALNNDTIAYACLDVLSTEPPSPDNPLLHAKHCTITPHIAWATRAARQRLMDIAVDNIRAFNNGTHANRVN